LRRRHPRGLGVPRIENYRNALGASESGRLLTAGLASTILNLASVFAESQCTAKSLEFIRRLLVQQFTEALAMSEEKMLSFDPANCETQDINKLLLGSVVPRPIAFVSTIDQIGTRNLAPFSFFTVVSVNPPVLAFCPSVPSKGVVKDTFRNILATGEFVVNIVSEEFAEQMNQCSAEVPPEVDEFALSRLTPVASELVIPPRVAESRVQMECRMLQVILVSNRPMGGSLVLGEVLRFHVREEIISNFRIDPDKLNAIGRMAGATYSRTTDRFQMERPKNAERQI
jgi:flavin reductase (DIM6/NTAB) family NADH-FMN oxidoreductase RutF